MRALTPLMFQVTIFIWSASFLTCAWPAILLAALDFFDKSGVEHELLPGFGPL
jgi:hypothetical protein